MDGTKTSSCSCSYQGGSSFTYIPCSKCGQTICNCGTSIVPCSVCGKTVCTCYRQWTTPSVFYEQPKVVQKNRIEVSVEKDDLVIDITADSVEEVTEILESLAHLLRD